MSYPQVTIDDREPSQLEEELCELGYEVEITHLTKGDFTGQTTIGEIKRGEDLFSSIADGRIFNQAKRMHSTGKERFLILAGNLSDSRFRLKPVIGALTTLVFDFQIGIIPVPNMEATIAYTIHQIISKVDGKERHPINYFQNRRPTKPIKDLDYNVTVEMLRTIHGIGLKHALTLSKGFPTIERLVTASVRELSSLQGIGPKLANKVFSTLRGH
ncbi:MAG: hypothetical protein JSV56_01400 [Methanomassiliicoccales archaeon]|nr:MAG: hypothetical protein JSV56_01400 [Methanomassiliicoccales archaeon]